MNKITGAEYSIGRIFSKDFDFFIPPYQRPYAWTTEECGELFDDLYDFMVKQPDTEAYFLGSIVLVKKENEALAEVIDGQQRLTSLTMLLATISSALTGPAAHTFAAYINEPGNLVENLSPKPRLTIRKLDSDFFRKYVQELHLHDMLSLQGLPDSQKRMRDNCRLFIDKFASALNGDHERILKFGKFLINRCYMVAVSTPSQASAFRIFTILNDRGLDLTTSDILKADILGKLPKDSQDKYTSIWESTEEELGRDNFNDLLRHIRMVYLKNKPQKTILEEIRVGVLVHFEDTARFIDDILLPYAAAFQIILNASYSSDQDNTLINDRLRWLLKIDNFDWMPPMIAYLVRNRNAPKRIEEFVVDLERIASSMFIRRKGINERIERYGEILTWIEGDIDLSTSDSPLMLDLGEDRETVKALNGDVYSMMKRPRTYILTKLDSILSDKLAIYEPSLITIEHILPQTVEAGSEWAIIWPNEELRDSWLHKIANLVLLTKPKNSAAQNWNFARKKRDYFSDKLGVSSSALTTTVLRESEWTPETVTKRQKMLIDTLKTYWGLQSDVLCVEGNTIDETKTIDPEEPSATFNPIVPEHKGGWNGEYYVNFGHGMGRDWDDAVKYGFISAGGGAWYSSSLRLLEIGKRIWVNVPGYGYTGVGVVESVPVKADEFMIDSPKGMIPFYSASLKADYHRDFVGQPDKAEYVVRIKWQKTLPLSMAVGESGLYGNQHTVCMSEKPKWEYTVQRLKALFKTNNGR